MPIKNKNMNMGIAKGNIPIKSVMIGTKCINGVDLTTFKILYPPISIGGSFFIEVNGIPKIIEPKTSGELEVCFEDSVTVKTYAEVGYLNPNSAVYSRGNSIIGIENTVNVDGISVIRSTTYMFSVNGDCSITLADALPAPKVNIDIIKDDGIDKVTIYYTKGVYEYSGLTNAPSGTINSSITTNKDIIEMYLYGNIESNILSVAKEGYKIVSTTKNYAGILTEENQCTINVVSQAGIRVPIICPPSPIGVTEYALNMVSSEYSRDLRYGGNFYLRTSVPLSATSDTLFKRYNNKFYFYSGDTIKITAKRKEGYKLPSLGEMGDISTFVTSKDIVLSDENVLVIESGEQGISVPFINQPLKTSEHVYLDVISDFTDRSTRALNPPIFVGDEIRIPLSHDYRIGSPTHRKPGVGLKGGGNVLVPTTFTSNITLQVPNVSVLTVDLIQGAARVLTLQHSFGSIATFYRVTNISPMQINYHPIRGKTFIPEAGKGTEDYSIKTFKMTYSCKRYLMDVNTDEFIKITQRDVPTVFSYFYDRTAFGLSVIKGTYTFHDDYKGITLNISRYDTDWVANTSDQANLIVDTIMV